MTVHNTWKKNVKAAPQDGDHTFDSEGLGMGEEELNEEYGIWVKHGQAKANGPTCSICSIIYIIRSIMVKSILLICGYIRCKVETALLNAAHVPP